MSIPHALKRGVVAAMAPLFLSVAPAPAHAAVVATFDPLYGDAIENLYFSGKVTFDVVGCFGYGSISSGDDGCAITPQSADLQYYDNRDPTDSLDSVHLSASDFPSGFVEDGYFSYSGQLKGLDTHDTNPFYVDVTSEAYGTVFSGYLELHFFNDQNNPADPVGQSQCPTGAPPSCGVGPSAAAPVTFGPTVRGISVATVPEPDSIALAALGLGALVASRRRRSPVET